MGLKLSREDIVLLMKQYMLKEYMYNIPAKKNVIEVLTELKKRGAKLNVLTASPHITLDACLIRLGIYDMFDNVWSCDDFNTTKANSEIYKMAAERIGEKVENILFLDDNYNADKTAKIAGMKVCGVYDESSAEYTDDIKKISDYYIYDFKELLDIGV
jgi:HAD superfamily hydrolase (TIGR01509 family)